MLTTTDATPAVPVRHPLGSTPSKIIAVHLNYLSRARERGRVPEHPSYFGGVLAERVRAGDALDGLYPMDAG
ncbi:MAG: hypothetical protein ACRDQ7_19120 [Haloechinothrix sp.]